jgi:4-diphosphocytidyl-2-C-methyl-D-erythritol kinase
MSRVYRSFAKVNLHLQVVGRRADGYHELRTLFQTIALHDLLEVGLGGRGVRLEVEGADLPLDERNLAHRAAARFLERWAPGEGVELRLRKRLPLGGGLGGGSSDAATVLLALRELVGQPSRTADLWPLARDLGADVPFFLVGGTALGFGRGDEVVPIPDLPEREVWVAVPPVSVKTAEIFAALAAPPSATLAPQILALAADERLTADWEDAAQNDLQELVLGRFNVIRGVYNLLREGGARWVRLSGSGGCLTARFDDPAQAEAVARSLPEGTRLERTRTLNRASVATLRSA